MKRQHSVPIGLIASLLSAPMQMRVDTDAVLARAGLKHWSSLIDELKSGETDPSTRVPLDEFGAFVFNLWQSMGDECGGFLSRPLKLGTFATMCHSLITAGNLRRAILRSARFIYLLTDDISIELDEDSEEATLKFVWSNPKNVDEVYFITSLFVLWIRLSCWLVDQPILLDRALFSFEEPELSDEFSMMFPCRLLFGQDENVVVFNSKMLALPLRQDPSTLTDFLSHAPHSLLTQFRADTSSSAQVKRILLKRGSNQLDLASLSFEQVSEELGTTTHTLRRRLKEEGHSFQEIKDRLRRDQAIDFLVHTEGSVQELSESLGFSEAAAFIRAFKKWTGTSPANYRSEAKKETIGE